MNHDLATFRKQSIFSQQDISDMLGKYDAVQISRHELSSISPQIELLLLYHIIFKKSLEQFFPMQIDWLKSRLGLRIPNIIDEWKCIDMNDTNRRRIECLQSILSDINQQPI